MTHNSSIQSQRESNPLETKGKAGATTSRELWTHPITVISLLIIAMTILLIAANVAGFDKGDTLNNLARIEYARGLITYLFAVGTIGAIISVILAILLGQESIDEKIKRAKDILTILIGLFGTIVGYYFGAQGALGASSAPAASESLAPAIQIAAPLGSTTFTVGQPLQVSTDLTGGIPPYRYWILVDSQIVAGVTDDQIMESLTITPTTDSLSVVLFVKDDAGNSGMAETMIPVQKLED